MNIIKKSLEHFDVPAEAFGDCRVILLGDRAEIENHRGILDFSENCLMAAVRGGSVRIRGSGFELCSVSKHLIVLRGQVAGVDLE